jgi:hypothetical protein
VGDLTFQIDIELIQVTHPHGTIPTVRMRYAHNSIIYAEVPLAHLPADIQEMFN